VKLFLPLLLAAVFVPLAAPAQTPTLDPNLGISVIPLWDGAPPGSSNLTPANTPSLTVFVPQHGHDNGTAVIVAPGGAYLGLAINLEGRQVADWFTARGVTAFILKYRLGPDNLYPIPLQDAQRAVRLVRSLAPQYKLAPDRIGIVGFSAGGHLAAMTGTLYDQGDPTAADPVAHFSSRPDFLVLGYPWLNAMQPNDSKLITYCSVTKVVPEARCKELEQTYTPALHVTAQTPPAFIYATTDDRTVPVSASVDFYRAMVAAGADAELHIFRHGAHGSGLGRGSAALDLWPSLLEQWMRDLSLLPVATPPAPGPR
jgi:acetyl esterase/lipase